MSFQELQLFLNQHQVYAHRKFQRHIVIRAHDFERIKHWFRPTTSVFHLKRPTWRSTSRWYHWHAVKFDEFVELHCDFGNLNRSYFLGIVHFFVDVLGYVFWCLLRHGKPWHKRDFSHLKEIKTQHPFHLVNVFSARVNMSLLDAGFTNKIQRV